MPVYSKPSLVKSIIYGPVIAVDVVDVDGAEGEWDVDDDEDEEEDHHVQDHVRHAEVF